jgi:hypothetical protein
MAKTRWLPCVCSVFRFWFRLKLTIWKPDKSGIQMFTELWSEYWTCEIQTFQMVLFRWLVRPFEYILSCYYSDVIKTKLRILQLDRFGSFEFQTSFLFICSLYTVPSTHDVYIFFERALGWLSWWHFCPLFQELWVIKTFAKSI